MCFDFKKFTREAATSSSEVSAKKTSSSKVGEREFLLKADVWVHEFKCSNVAVFYENLIYSFRWVTNLVTFYLYGQNILGLNHVCLGSTRNDHPGETHSGDGN